MSGTRKWSLLAVVVIAAILAAGWFLLVSPKRSEASELRSQTTQQESDNSRLEAQLAVLKAQQADLPKQQARLAALHRQVPDNPALPTLIRSLTRAGNDVGVSIDTMAPAPPVAVVVAAPVAPLPAATTDSSTSSDSSGTATEPAPIPAPAAASLYQVPLTLNVSGSYFELEQFVNRLEGLKRSFLVTGFTVSSSNIAEEAAPGDLSLVLQGRVFIAPAEAAATTPTPVAAATTGQ